MAHEAPRHEVRNPYRQVFCMALTKLLAPLVNSFSECQYRQHESIHFTGEAFARQTSMAV